LGECFTFEDQNDAYVWEYSSGYVGPTPDERGDIILRGSLAQYRRGYVHRSNHSGTGYTKHYFYDSRLDSFWLPGIKARHIAVFDPPELDFGPVAVGEAETLDVYLNDEGGTYIDIRAAHTRTPAFGVLPVDSTTLAPGDSITFQVRFCPPAVSPYLDTLTVELYYGADLKVPLSGSGTVLGVAPKSLPETYGLKVYPNPFNGQIRISYDRQDGLALLTIWDINGQLVESARFTGVSYTWKPEGLAGGTYFLGLTTAGQTVYRKVVYLK